MKYKFDDWQLRLSDLETLVPIASSYKSLESMLSSLALEPPERGVAGVVPEYEEEKPLTLSTIHSAKGLEWEVVYLIGLVDGVLPSKFALKSEEQLEEEHRLFYVAVTRAKKQLFLFMHHEGRNGGILQFNRLSRFVEQPNILKQVEQRMLAYEAENKDICIDDDLPF